MDYEKKALVIRTCNADMTAHGGFIWPKEGNVEAPDWNPTAECGGGLHGLIDGFGNYSLLSSAHDAVWQIVEVERAECIDIEGKVKFPRGTVIYSGDMAIAMTKISDWKIGLLLSESKNNSASNASSGNSASNVSSGNHASNASSGDSASNASSGNYASNASSGNSASNVSSGNHASNASSGDSASNASSGNYASNASSGYSASNASSGNYARNASSGDSASNASSGNYASNASSGNYASNASSGNYARNASSGYYARNVATGNSSICMAAGLKSQASSGELGTIALTYWDDEAKRYRVVVGYIGENGLEPNVMYRLNDAHQFEAVK
jgi:hypothetical protein